MDRHCLFCSLFYLCCLELHRRSAQKQVEDDLQSFGLFILSLSTRFSCLHSYHHPMASPLAYILNSFEFIRPVPRLSWLDEFHCPPLCLTIRKAIPKHRSYQCWVLKNNLDFLLGNPSHVTPGYRASLQRRDHSTARHQTSKLAGLRPSLHPSIRTRLTVQGCGSEPGQGILLAALRCTPGPNTLLPLSPTLEPNPKSPSGCRSLSPPPQSG